MGAPVKCFHLRPLPEGFIHDVLALAGGLREKFHQFIEGFGAEVIRETQAVTSLFQGADGL